MRLQMLNGNTNAAMGSRVRAWLASALARCKSSAGAAFAGLAAELCPLPGTRRIDAPDVGLARSLALMRLTADQGWGSCNWNGHTLF